MASDRVQRNIERLLDQVDEAIARRDWTSVRDNSHDILALDPENTEASAFLAAATRALASGSSEPQTVPPPPETILTSPIISCPAISERGYLLGFRH